MVRTLLSKHRALIEDIKCSVALCKDKIYCKEMCNRHYIQFYKHGKILNNKRHIGNDIILCKKYAIVVLRNKYDIIVGRSKIDKEMILFTKSTVWYLHGGYMYSKKYGFFHKYITSYGILYKTGKLCDHINRNKLDNRRKNLRLVSVNVNIFNRDEAENNTSGCRGVVRQNGKWRVRLNTTNKNYSFGMYNNKNEAIKMRKKVEKRYMKKLLSEE